MKLRYLFFGIFILSIHVLISFILYLTSFSSNNFLIISDFLFIFLICFLITLEIVDSKPQKFTSTSKFGEIFLKNTKTISALILTFLGLNLVFYVKDFFLSGKILNWFENEIIFIIMVSLTFTFLYFKVNWISQIKSPKYRHHNRVFYFILILYSLILFLNYFKIAQIGNLSLENIKFILAICLALIFLVQLKIKTWLPLSPRPIQKSILWYSLLTMLSLLVLLSTTPRLQNEVFYSKFYFLEYANFLSISLLITYLRVFYVSIISLPLSRVLEQKVYEINSLSYLNKIVKNFSNLDYIFQTIVELSSISMRQSFAWIQTYNSSNLSLQDSFFFLNKDFFANITNNKHIQDIIRKTLNPSIIPSITDVLQQNQLIKQETCFESFCIIPINFRETQIGHLVVANENSYFFDDDDLNLLISYVEALSIAIEGNYLLIEKIEKEKYKKELLIAKEIQSHFLPKALPNLSNFEIEVFFKPSEEVGGDFYDFIPIDEHRFLVLIGDVSGKGMSAALYMALLKGIILSSNKNPLSLQHLFSHVNSSLYKKIEPQIHITLAGLLLDFESRKFEFIRAGHPPLIFKNSQGIYELNPQGIGISISDTNFFERNTSVFSNKFEKDNFFLLYTDGLPEVLGRKNLILGINKMKQILATGPDSNTNTDSNANILNTHILMENFLKEIQKFGTEFDDDLTLVIIKT